MPLLDVLIWRNLSFPQVFQIGKYAFANCLSLNKLEFESIIQNRRELSYIFPSQLDKVPSYAF